MKWQRRSGQPDQVRPTGRFVENARFASTKMTSFEPSGQADQVKSTGRFVKMSVSPRRNDQFAAGPERRSAILNDSTAVLNGLQPNASQGIKARQVEICSINVFMD